MQRDRLQSLFVATFGQVGLVSVVLLDSSRAFVCSSDVLLRVSVGDRCFVGRGCDVPVRQCSRRRRRRFLEHVGIVRAKHLLIEKYYSFQVLEKVSLKKLTDDGWKNDHKNVYYLTRQINIDRIDASRGRKPCY